MNNPKSLLWQETPNTSPSGDVVAGYRTLRLLNYRNLAADVRDVNAEHRAIMDAVLERDAPRAVELMNTHLRKTEDAVARLLTPASSEKVSP